MTFNTQYLLDEFRAKQPDSFDSDGRAYRTVYPYSTMDDMLKLINALEEEIRLLEIKSERI
jgi:hypothetical protein